MEKKKKNLKNVVWRVPTIPKFSVKKGPIDFIDKLWKSETRFCPSTIAINPLDDPIDLGGTFEIDLWRYLKTELWNNWK